MYNKIVPQLENEINKNLYKIQTQLNDLQNIVIVICTRRNIIDRSKRLKIIWKSKETTLYMLKPQKETLKELKQRFLEEEDAEELDDL